MIVFDASAALSALYNDGVARGLLAAEQVHAPHLIDSEVANGLRRAVTARGVDASTAGRLLDTWRRLGLIRYPVHPVLDRIWQLRDNLSASDAGYVALAESLGCGLITADVRMTGAPGIRCPVTLVPR